jgi:hypothetical protein
MNGDGTALNLDDVLAELDSDDVPEDVRKLDDGDDAAKGKASHAFAEQKRKYKETLLRLKQEGEKNQRELDELKKKSVAPQAAPAAPSAGGVSRAQALKALENQAMQNLGVMLDQSSSQEDRRLVDLEVQRLYSQSMNMLAQVREATSQAPRVVEEKLGRFKQLGDEDKAEIKRRLSAYNAVQQMDDEVIRGVVVQYFGEQRLAGASDDGAGDDSAAFEGDASPAPNPKERVASVAAASAAKTGRPTVKALKGNGSRPEPKPATPEEMKEMAKLGIHDVTLFRDVKARSSKYRTEE